MNLPKKIVTARDIIEKVFPECIFIYSEEAVTQLYLKMKEEERQAWHEVLQLKDTSMGALLEFFSQYNVKEELACSLMFAQPNKELLEVIGLPQKFLDRADIACNKCKVTFETLEEQSKLSEQKQEILNYLEALVLENKLKILGEWQGEDTRIIINDWEEIDQLFDINSISQKENENTGQTEQGQCENTARKRFEKWLEDNKDMKYSPCNSDKVKYRRLSTYFEITFNNKKPKELADKYENEYGYKDKQIKTISDTIKKDIKIAKEKLVNKEREPIQ